MNLGYNILIIYFINKKIIYTLTQTHTFAYSEYLYTEYRIIKKIFNNILLMLIMIYEMFHNAVMNSWAQSPEEQDLTVIEHLAILWSD